MAIGDGSFRSRAASLIPHAQQSVRRSLRRGSNAEKPVFSPKAHQADRLNDESAPLSGLEPTQTHTSSGDTQHTSGSDAVAHDREARRVVRTIPPWVQILREDDEDLQPSKSPAVPAPPHLAQHNYIPTFFGPSHSARGRLHDHERTWTPPLPGGSVQDTGSRWRAFAESSAYPRVSTDLEGEIMSQDWLVQHGPDYSRPWLAGAEDGDPEKGNGGMFRPQKRRRAWYEVFARTILRSPLVPLIIRMVVFGFSMVALALACSIYRVTPHNNRGPSASSVNQNNSVHTTPSTMMAIVVDAVAMIYLIGITYDEYSGKPLGLRPPSTKMRLILLDLFFIVFDSANLSLAFEALGDNTSCGSVCDQQRSLASVLLIALIAWLMTFSISVMRVVERVHN